MFEGNPWRGRGTSIVVEEEFGEDPCPWRGGSTFEGIFGGKPWMEGVFGDTNGTSGVERYFWPFSGEPPPGRGAPPYLGGIHGYKACLEA